MHVNLYEKYRDKLEDHFNEEELESMFDDDRCSDDEIVSRVRRKKNHHNYE